MGWVAGGVDSEVKDFFRILKFPYLLQPYKPLTYLEYLEQQGEGEAVSVRGREENAGGCASRLQLHLCQAGLHLPANPAD